MRSGRRTSDSPRVQGLLALRAAASESGARLAASSSSTFVRASAKATSSGTDQTTSAQRHLDPRHLVGGQVDQDSVVVELEIENELVMEVGLAGPGRASEGTKPAADGAARGLEQVEDDSAAPAFA